MPSKARAAATTQQRSLGKWMLCSVHLALLLLLLLLQQQMALALRIGYRLPQSAGRSAASTNAGSERGLFKKFMLFRDLFPQEPTRENIIVIPQSSPTFTTPTTTTTTTTTIVNDTDTRRWRHLDHVIDQPMPTLPTSEGSDDEGSQQRITRRRRPNTRSGNNNNNNKQGRHKKKRRHRHIHKRQRHQRHQRHRR